MQFPAIVYRTPGPFGRPGKTYAYLGVADQEALDHALAHGWHESKAAALAPVLAQSKIDDFSSPTRDEMDQKAKALGIRGYHRMKDETLAERIAEYVG